MTVQQEVQALLLVEALKSSSYAGLLDEHEPEVYDWGIVVGPIEVLPGQVPDKPVLRDSKTKSKMKGSGQYPKKAETAKVTEQYAYRDKADYREAFERLFPAGGDVTERGSLAWLFDQFWEACEGSPQMVDCPHPEEHKERGSGPIKHLVAFKKDAPSMFKMIELGVGKAAQTVNVNTHEEKLVRILEQRNVDVVLHGISVDEVEARAKALEGYGYKVLEAAVADRGSSDSGAEADDAGPGSGSAGDAESAG